jgi:ribosomal protein S18 acetylase RimI-like enzyme
MTDTDSNLLHLNRINNVTIRKLTRPDLPALEWDGEYIHFRNVFINLYKRMQQGTAFAWVADVPENGIIGQLFLQLDCDRPELADGLNRAYMYSFRLKPEYRNLGIGTQMLKVCDDFLQTQHYRRVTLNVARNNPDAIRLYKRCGYQIVAEEPGIWSYMDHLGKWHTVEEPSWRMEKEL